MRSEEKTLGVNGVELCVHTFGDPADPAVLLIGGAAASMDYWEDGFCAGLADGRRHVIRYDTRDTGRSVGYPPGSPGYTFPDLVTDALGILDALGVGRAHLVGISMGGVIVQRLAVDHPDRVASLTLISTSLDGADRSELPPPAVELRAAFADPPPDPDWSDRAAVIDHLVAGERLFVGAGVFDEPHVRDLATRVLDRTNDIAAAQTNHWTLDGGDPAGPRLNGITAPALILHGTVDPLFPLGHAEALARAIPTARLVPLDGVGHQMPPPTTWGVVIPEILRHTV